MLGAGCTSTQQAVVPSPITAAPTAAIEPSPAPEQPKAAIVALKTLDELKELPAIIPSSQPLEDGMVNNMPCERRNTNGGMNWISYFHETSQISLDCCKNSKQRQI